MKTLYKFGFMLQEDETLWAQLFLNLFGIDVTKEKINTQLDTKEKRWLDTYRNLEVFKKNRRFCGYELESIYLFFNRYQEYVYIMLLFDEIIEDVDNVREKIKEVLFVTSDSTNFVDNFEIPFKEPDVHVEDKQNFKYLEILSIGNPIYIKDKDDIADDFCNNYLNSDYKEHGLNNVITTAPDKSKLCIRYNIKYSSNQNNKYNRFFNQIYILDSFKNVNLAIEHFHSIFVLFHRAESHYKELKKMDYLMNIMGLLSDKLNEIWPRERIKLFLINRFIHAGLYNKTFYSVLELNAQMNSIFSQIQIKYQKIEDKFEKQYERVLYNFKESDILEVPYYKNLLDYLNKPISQRKKTLHQIKDFFEPTDAQIERLRSDNDSKVNFAIQWIMSILSVIIFFWGISTFWYQGMISINKNQQIVDYVIENLPWIPYKMSIMISSTILVSILSIIYFLVYNSSSNTNELKNVIKSNNLELEILRKKFKEIHEKKLENKKNKLLIITETFKLITTYIILNFEKEEENSELLKSIKSLIEKI